MNALRTIIGITCLIFLATSPISAADDVRVSVSVDQNDITMNEQIQLEIVLENADQFPNFKLSLDKFSIISGPAKSSNFQWINGESFSSKKIIYTIAPLEQGDHQIGPLTINYDGQTYTTDPITIHVSTSARNQAQGQSSQDQQSNQTSSSGEQDAIFIEATADKTTAYPGEQITVTYRLYTRVSVRNYSIEGLPDAVGFWKEDIATPSNPRLTQEVVNGVRYNKAIIKKVAYFPTKSGQLTIEPMPVTVEIQTSRSRSAFDNFFRSPFGRSATKRLVGNALTIDVQPLPGEGKPASFTGAVGEFRLTSSLDTNVVKVDEAVGLNVTVSGVGNIPTITVPSLEVPEGLDMFDPEVEKSNRVESEKLRGEVAYQYVFIPRREGEISLPSVQFSYFNPKTKRYTTLQSGAKTVRVVPLDQPQRVTGTGYSREEVKLLNMDIRYLKPNSGQFRQADSSYYSTWKYYGLLILSIFIIGGSVGYRYWYEEWGQDTAYLRRKNAMKHAQEHIKQAQSNKGDPEYFSQLAKSVLGFIGDKNNIAENALNTEDVKAVLQQNQVPAGTIQQVEAFLNQCDAGRFAPAKAGNAEEDSMADQAKSLVKTLNGYL